jgi:hypothetical protein
MIMPEYIVKQGECVETIAKRSGHFWETIWNHTKNNELRQQREDPNALAPGDFLFIPDLRPHAESGATGQRHRFHRKGVPSELCIVVKHQGEPFADKPYRLDVDGKLFYGKTDQSGQIFKLIPPDAKSGKLVVGQGEEELEYVIDLGYVDPISTVTGVQTRLNNLGFDCGAVDGVLGLRTQAALRDFQRKYEITESGELDESTRQKLKEAYGR